MMRTNNKKSVEKTSPFYDSLSDIKTLQKKFQAKKTLLITGRESYSSSGAKSIVELQLDPQSYVTFNDFSINPKLYDGIRGAEFGHEHNIDLIIAVGGGSVLDMAKLVKAFMSAPTQARQIATGEIELSDSGIPLIAVPTTAGSGSEATHFAVVYIGKTKHSLASSSLLPNEVILDATLLQSASSYQRAINGLDALAQAIEGCWAVNSSYESRKLSFQAIALLIDSLPKIIKGNTDNNNKEHLQNVLYGAHLAGQVINTTKTTAAHALSYAFTSYHDIPHGHAVWLTLPAIFELHYNANASQVIDKRGRQHLQMIMQSLAKALGIDSNNIKESLQSFMRELGVEPYMEALGIDTKIQKKFIATQVNTERLQNNPVVIDQNSLDEIF